MTANPELAAELAPLAFLVGRWTGLGVGDYPTIEPFQFSQELVIEHDGRPVLSHWSRTWLLDQQTGEQLRPLASEAGFWRPGRDHEVELVLAHSGGTAEVWIGHARGPTVELVTDLVARTSTAHEVTAGHRLYGLVEGELLQSYDMAAVGQPMQPHLSSRLRRV